MLPTPLPQRRESGPQGIQGNPGTNGAPGADGLMAPFLFTQVAPALVWTINHNRGQTQLVGLYSVGGVELEADVLNVSSNQVQVTFAVATAGTARLL